MAPQCAEPAILASIGEHGLSCTQNKALAGVISPVGNPRRTPSP